MASFRYTLWWTWMVVACFAAGASAAWFRRDISNRVGNGTIQLQLTTGGFLNAVGSSVSYTDSCSDYTTYWRVEQYIIGGVLDDSVYLYNYATGKYLTYVQSVPPLIRGGVTVQILLTPVYGRWYFYESADAAVFKIRQTSPLAFNFYVSLTGSNEQDRATAFIILPVATPTPDYYKSPPPPPPPPPPQPATPLPGAPPAFKQATIQALRFPHVYLHTDGKVRAADGYGEGKLVNLKYSLDGGSRYELVPLRSEGLNDVYAIRSVAYNLYVRLDPTVLAGQEPPADRPGFYPRGVGRTSAVAVVDAYSKFQLIVNLPTASRPQQSYSFRLVNAEQPRIYLRFDGKGVTKGKPGGVVNGQTYISDYERFLVKYY